MKCRVTRDKKGLDRHAYPTYFLHLERDDGKKVFVCFELLFYSVIQKICSENYQIFRPFVSQ